MAPRKSTTGPARLPYPVRGQLAQVRALLESGRATQAEQRLKLLDHAYDDYPEVLELWVDVHYEARDWPAYEWDLFRLVQAAPEHALAAYALGAACLVMKRQALAVQAMQAFLERWPEHEKAPDARQVLDEAQPQAARRAQQLGLPEQGSGLLADFERAELLHEKEAYQAADRQLQQVLAQQEDWLPALRLQIQVRQEEGDLAGALASLERLLAQHPADSMALAQQVQLRLCSGEPSAARQAADRLLAQDPEQPAIWMHQLLALAWLGAGKQALALYQRSQQAGPQVVNALDRTPYYQHLAAYAHALQGEEQAAQQLWQRALAGDPNLLQARENLDDLREPPTRRCGPWAFGLLDWLPAKLTHELLALMEQGAAQSGSEAWQGLRGYLEAHPQLAQTAHYMLQRGSRPAIELVLGLAALSQHPPLLGALQAFFTGQHGTDAHRLQAAYLLLANDRIAPGEQRLWLFGEWHTLNLRRYEVAFEPVRIPASPRVQRLVDRAFAALMNADYRRGQELLERALELAPDLPELINNLAFACRELGELDRAQELVEDLRRRFPDYLPGVYAEAQIALNRGEIAVAAGLLEQIAGRPQLHISELETLCRAQVEMHMQEDRRPEALAWLELWAFYEPDSQDVDELREQYFAPRSTSGLAQKLARRLSGPPAPQD